jgi:hypothetical protein
MNFTRWQRMRSNPSGAAEAIGWAEVVVGYDFSLLSPEDVVDWVRAQGFPGEACARLLALSGEALLSFEARMWEACTECFGRVPRPGESVWAQAQDRWRRVLLQEALAGDLTEPALAEAIESIYECVGCPEDMLDLWSRKAPWQGRPERVNFEALCVFLGLPRIPANAPAAA